jgi:hypothetical protein
MEIFGYLGTRTAGGHDAAVLINHGRLALYVRGDDYVYFLVLRHGGLLA